VAEVKIRPLDHRLRPDRFDDDLIKKLLGGEFQQPQVGRVGNDPIYA
jgi:hypothetical protein